MKLHILQFNIPCLFLICVSWFASGQDDGILNLVETVRKMQLDAENERIRWENSMSKMAKELYSQKKIMAKIDEEIQNERNMYTYEIKQLTDKVEKFQSEIHESRNKSEKDRTNRRMLSSSEHVAFSARLTGTLTGLAEDQTIVFDEKVSDFGNNYDNSDGIFTAPVNGIYVFTWTVGTHSDRNQETALVKHGNAMAYSYADSSDNDGAQVTNTVVIQVNKGEHVMVKTTAWTYNNHVIDHGRANTFSGWLLWTL